MTVHASFVIALLLASTCADAQVAASETTEICTSQECELTKSLAELNLANPIADLERNVQSGDWRFIGICSYACEALGAEKAEEPWSDYFGTRALKGTSCIVEDDTHRALIERAMNYARTYNVELLRRIRAGSSPNTSLERTRER